MGMLSPGGCTWQYRSTRSAIIQKRVTRAGSGAQLTAALCHSFIRCQDSLCRGSSAPNRLSIAYPASSVLSFLSSLRLVLIARPRRRRRVWFCADSRRAETLLLTSLHVSSKIHTFFLASRAFGLGIAPRRPTKSLSSLLGVVRGRRGSRVRRLRYSVCYLRVAMTRNPSTM